jgi:ABC-2 type transport system ATP-binding protein
MAGVPESNVEEALRTVELDERAGEKFKNYSLGMKQRLGVASALLKNPPLLILDEPTNGLDPRGILDMRALIRKLGQGERTVLLSSHLLAEVEQIADRVGVINHGHLIREGTVAELRGAGGILLRVEPVDRALELLGSIPGVQGATVQDGAIQATADPSLAATLNRELVQAGLEVSEVRPLQQSLEQVFLELTEAPPNE